MLPLCSVVERRSLLDSRQTPIRRNDCGVMYEIVKQKQLFFIVLMSKNRKAGSVEELSLTGRQAAGGGWREDIISFPESGAVFHSSGQGNNYGRL